MTPFKLAIAAAVALTGVSACSSEPAAAPQPPGSLPPNSAHISVNGQDAGAVNNLTCRQTGSIYSIETGDTKAGLTAMIQFGDKISAQSVEIRNLAGFTGSYWQGDVGKGDATALGDTYRITGTAVGSNSDKPNAQISVPFEVRANC